MRRTLIYIPMLHRYRELALRQPRNAVERAEWESHDDLVLRHWSEVKQHMACILSKHATAELYLFLESWIDAQMIRVFRQRHKMFLESESDMYHFNAWMLERGARPRVTESALLHQLACFWRHISGAFKLKSIRGNFLVLNMRDRAIARRLHRSVPDGAVAVLSMGCAHDVPSYLDDSWDVRVVSTSEIMATCSTLTCLKWKHLYMSQCKTAPF